MSVTVLPTRRSRRKPAAQVGNVIPLHAPKETTEDIVKDVQDRSRREDEHILGMLQGLVSDLKQRHRETAQQLVPIGCAMDMPMLMDFIEIGRRMLGQKGGRR